MYKDPFASSRNNNPSRMGGMRANKISAPKPYAYKPQIGGSFATSLMGQGAMTPKVPSVKMSMPTPRKYNQGGIVWPGSYSEQPASIAADLSRSGMSPAASRQSQQDLRDARSLGSGIMRPATAITPAMQAEIDQRVIDMGPEYGYDASPVEGPYADDLSISQRVWLNAREEGRQQRAEAHDRRLAELRQRTHSIRPGWDYDMANTPRANRPQTISGTSAPDYQQSSSLAGDIVRPLVGYSDTGIGGGMVSPVYGMSPGQMEAEREYMQMLNARRPSRFPTIQSGPASDLAGAIQSGGYGGDYSAVNDMLPIPMQHTEVSANLTPEQRAAMNERRAARMNRGRDFITQNAQDQAIGRKQRLEQRKWNQVPRPMTLEQQLMASGDPRTAMMMRQQNMMHQQAMMEDQRRREEFNAQRPLTEARTAREQAEADAMRRGIDETYSQKYRDDERLAFIDAQEREGMLPPHLRREREEILARRENGYGEAGDASGQQGSPSEQQQMDDLNSVVQGISGIADKYGIPTTDNGQVDIERFDPLDVSLNMLDDMGDIDGEDQISGAMYNHPSVTTRSIGDVTNQNDAYALSLAMSGAGLNPDGSRVDANTAKKRFSEARKYMARRRENRNTRATLPVVDGYKLTEKNRRVSLNNSGYGPNVSTNVRMYEWRKVD